jgi:hypothetical protein
LIYILSNSNSFQVGFILYNLKNIETLVLLITLELQKLQKFAIKLSTNSTIQNLVNKELLGQLKKEDNKKKQVVASNKNLIRYSRYIGEEVLKERYN